MITDEFFRQLEARIAKYDLLCHPFYQAWSAGRLTRDDLREYAQDYYHHVEAFPSYLAALLVRSLFVSFDPSSAGFAPLHERSNSLCLTFAL